MEVPENIKERFSAIGSKIKVGGAEVSRKFSARINVVGGRVKELFQAPSLGERMVEEATAENLRAPDWGKYMEICDSLNDRRVSGQDVVRGIKKRLMMSKNAGVQLLALTLLETCVKNHEKMFAEMASERVLDEMVKMAEDPQTWPRCRDKALVMIEAWGEATEELRYLPVYEETYKSMRVRGVRFPGRDSSSLSPIFTPKTSANDANVSSRGFHSSPPGTNHAAVAAAAASNGINMSSLSAKEAFDVARNSAEVLSTVLSSSPQPEVVKEELTISLVEQCRQAQTRVQRIAQKGEQEEGVLFEALTVNDELEQVLRKFEELCAAFASAHQLSSRKPAAAEAAVLTAEVVEVGVSGYDPLSDLDEDAPDQQEIHRPVKR